MKKIEKLDEVEVHKFCPSDAKELCQVCGKWEDEHFYEPNIIGKINEIIERQNAWEERMKEISKGKY